MRLLLLVDFCSRVYFTFIYLSNTATRYSLLPNEKMSLVTLADFRMLNQYVNFTDAITIETSQQTRSLVLFASAATTSTH